MCAADSGETTTERESDETPPAMPTGEAISRAIDRFQVVLDAVRELEERIMPQASVLDDERFSPAALAAVTQFPPHLRAELETWLRESGERRKLPPGDEDADETGRPGEDTDETETTDASPANRHDTLLLKQDSEKPTDDEAVEPKTLADILGSRPALMLAFLRHLYRSAISPARANLLRGSLLVAALGAFEVFVGTLAREYYMANPGALGDEPKFSLKDLQDFETLDDARDVATSTRVDRLLRGDLEDWEKWFADHPKLILTNYYVDRSDFDEMFQRRHAIVHNDGKVSRTYLRRLSARTDLPALDSSLPVSRSYLESALDALDAAGMLLGTGMRSKLFPHEQVQAMKAVNDRVFVLMLRGRWLPVRKLCGTCSVIRSSAELQEIFKANGWLAEKRLGNFDSVAAQVRDWDVSALHPRFRFVKLLLLGQLDNAFALAVELLERGDLEANEFEEWPVLEEFRGDERYGDFIAKASQ